MSFPEQTPFVSSVGDGVAVNFSYNFQVDDASEMQVFIDGVAQGSGYTVNNVGNQAGGTITFSSAPANGAVVARRRNAPISRTDFDYQFRGDFSSDEVDNDFNRRIRQLQQINELLSRALKINVDAVIGSGVFDAQSQRIGNVSDPVNDQDAATKLWTLSQNASLFTETGIVSIAAARSLVATDQGKVIYLTGTTYALTIDPDSTYDFPDGSMILLNCNTSGNVTITRGSGVALNWFDGVSVSDANRTLSVGGVACLVKRTDDTWHIWGNGGLT